MKFTTGELREMFKNFYKSKRSKDKTVRKVMDSNCKTTMCYFFNKKFLFNCNADENYMELCFGKGVIIERKTSNKLLEEAAPEMLEALIKAYKFIPDAICNGCNAPNECDCIINQIVPIIEKAKGMKIEEVLEK